MMKAIVLLGAGLIGFLIAFSLVAKDEIAAQVAQNLDEDFVPKCVRQLGRQLPDTARATDICGCMKSEFKTKGYAITDAFGKDRADMQRITQSCAQLYS